MKKTLMIVALLGTSALAACAPSASSIAPVPMGNAYANVSCQQAANDLAVAKQSLEALSQQQNNAAAGDAIGVFLIGVPVSSLTGGNKAGGIAAEKGKIIALEARLRSC